MALSDIQIKQAKPEAKDSWLSDEKGLRLLIKPNGSKYWRLKYRFDNKQKTLALGVYPDVSLKAARAAVVEAKQQIAGGIDPSQQKQVDKLTKGQDIANSFASMAKEWWEHQQGRWTPDHAHRVWTRLQDNVFAFIGDKPINDIPPQLIIQVIRRIEDRGALDVASRVLQAIKSVCRYAVQTGKAASNPASELAGILKGYKSEHRASLPRSELPEFLRLLANYHHQGRLLTRLAIELLVLTFLRQGELRGARWSEFDIDAKLWRIPAERMKMKSEHLVPLSKQSLAVIEQLRPLTGHYELLFPSERNPLEPMSDNTMRRAIFKLGYDGNTEGKSKANPHGFRATASSILNETGFNPDAIERQLSHMERNGVRAAYTHHARYMDERTTMMQWWADYLDELKEGCKVIPIFSKKA
jgi:integrase